MQAVHERIAAAAREAGRPAQDVALLAISKTFPSSAIAEAHGAGQRLFGENYVQEALDKMRDLAHLALEWHYVGPIQSNKTRPIAEHFHWAHGVDREKIAVRLSQSRPSRLPPLQVCIQVNLGAEATKSGIAPDQALPLARAIVPLPGLRLRGLMTIPEPSRDIGLQRSRFRALRELRDEITRHGIPLDTLSMGMSDDLEAAVLEGATLVRIGTAIFGARQAIPAS